MREGGREGGGESGRQAAQGVDDGCIKNITEYWFFYTCRSVLLSCSLKWPVAASVVACGVRRWRGLSRLSALVANSVFFRFVVRPLNMSWF